uniref:ATP synthase subunit 8 n=1 Tax=Amblyomma latum TaxID=34617 RepID=A0A977XUP6_9ACAR|nr:ATP synthase F0 subunit 8 [Amblyomma latum]UXX50162.1 ATP synthase subunit 8 [Amblyomma latum]
MPQLFPINWFFIFIMSFIIFLMTSINLFFIKTKISMTLKKIFQLNKMFSMKW